MNAPFDPGSTREKPLTVCETDFRAARLRSTMFEGVVRQ